LGYVQKDLARAAQVTESYISQLLSRKKAPPAPNRTDLYDRIGEFLDLPAGELARLAQAQRLEQLRRHIGEEPIPLFREARALILRKCAADKREHLRGIFEREPFGALERLVTQTLVDVVKGQVRAELGNEDWLRMIALAGGLSYEAVRERALDFMDSDVLHVSIENCVAFLDPVIASWDIDLATFGLEVLLNRQGTTGATRRFSFRESESDMPAGNDRGFREFLRDATLSGSATESELEYLRALPLRGRVPTALFYYRELQGLRDPLHFEPAAGRGGRTSPFERLSGVAHPSRVSRLPTQRPMS